MDCLICSKSFKIELDYKDSPLPNPKLCANSIIKLLEIKESNHQDVHRVFNNPKSTLLCGGCHTKLKEVNRAFKLVDLIEKVLPLAKEVIRNDLVRGLSNVMAKIPQHRMSAASLGRVTILKAIGTAGIFEAETELDVKNDEINVPNVKKVVVKKESVEEIPQVQELEAPPNVPMDVSSETGNDGRAKTVAQAKRKEFMCKVCSKMLPSKSSLARHQDLYGHVNSRRAQHKCKYCSRKFGSKALLKKHWGDKTPTECSICDPRVTLQTPGCFMQHDFIVHGKGLYSRKGKRGPLGSVSRYFTRVGDGSYKCVICSKIVKNTSQHKKAYHSDI